MTFIMTKVCFHESAIPRPSPIPSPFYRLFYPSPSSLVFSHSLEGGVRGGRRSRAALDAAGLRAGVRGLIPGNVLNYYIAVGEF